MRALLAVGFLPLTAATTLLTVRQTTCSDHNHAKTSFTGITGQFTDACGAYADGTPMGCPSQTLGSKVNGRTDTAYFTIDGSTFNCFKISTTNSDGWKFCSIEISATTGGENGMGGTWSWTGQHWVDKPCSGNYGYGSPCTNDWENCVWDHVANSVYPSQTPSQTPVVAPATCQAVVHEHYGHTGRTETYVGPMTGVLHANAGGGQASTIVVTGTPGCVVTLYCHAGHSCTYHGNSLCHSSGVPCAGADGNWEEVLTVPASGSIDVTMQHNDPQNAYINIRPNGNAGGLSGDPFTTDKYGNKVQFFLPLHQEQHLLTCDGTQLYGRAMSSGIAGDHQQWFDSFRVVRGEELLKVESINGKLLLPRSEKVYDPIDVSRSNSTEARKLPTDMRPLTTMKVAVMKQAIKKTAAVAYNGFEMAVTQNEAKRIGTGYLEMVDFATGDIRMQFTSAVASKFTSKTEQVLHTHLDVNFLNLNTAKCSEGILAEIWGLKKMSAATARMLQA